MKTRRMGASRAAKAKTIMSLAVFLVLVVLPCLWMTSPADAIGLLGSPERSARHSAAPVTDDRGGKKAQGEGQPQQPRLESENAGTGAQKKTKNAVGPGNDDKASKRLQKGIDNAPGGILFALENDDNPPSTGGPRPPVRQGNMNVKIVPKYDEGRIEDPVHPDRLHVTIGGYFDLSKTVFPKLINGLSDWGSAWMALLDLPDYISAKNALDGVNEAYRTHRDDFKCTVYNGQQFAAYGKNANHVIDMPFTNTKFISEYDGRHHDEHHAHTLQLHARGDSMEFGYWELYNLWLQLDSTSDVYLTLEFDIDVHAATKDGLAGADNDYFDQSPDAYLTRDALPPAKDGSFSISGRFYAYDKVANELEAGFSTSPEIHIREGQESAPTLSLSSDPIPTWCYYVSPWDTRGIYNTQVNPYKDVIGKGGVPPAAILPGSFGDPRIIWDARRDGKLADADMTRFGRVVNIMDRKVEDLGKKLSFDISPLADERTVVSFSPVDEKSDIDTHRTWKSFFRDQKSTMTIYDFSARR